MKLPFVVQPKQQEVHLVGDETTGKLEIPKLYDLSVNERIYLDTRETSLGVESVGNSAVMFAKEIAARSGIKFNEAYQAILDNNMDVIGPFAELLVDFNKEYAKFTLNRKIALATLMLQRILPEATEEMCGDATQVAPKMVNLLAEYAQKEMNGWEGPKPENKKEPVSPKGKLEEKPTGKVSTGK